MKDPKRWKEPGSDAPAHLQELFRNAKPTRNMTDAEKARSIANLAQLPATPIGAAPFIAAPKLLALVLGVGGVVALVAGGLQHGSTPETPPRVPIVVQVPVKAPEAVETMRPSPTLEAQMRIPETRPTLPRSQTPIAPTPRKTAPSSTVPTSHPESVMASAAIEGHDSANPTSIASPPPKVVETEESPLMREAKLIEEARRVVSSNPSGALVRLDEHARLFPHGVLTVDREFLAIRALVQLGRVGEARTRGEALQQLPNGTAYRARVLDLLKKRPSFVAF